MNQGEKDNLEFELSQYLDGQLSGRRARRLERRLAQEPALQEEFKAYASLDSQLSALGGRELAGVDYESQRTEVVRMLERKTLLESPRRRPIILFRPVFWAAGGALAVAATVIVAVTAWMGPGTVSKPVAESPTAAISEVSVALIAPSAAPQSEAKVELRKLDESQIALPDTNVGETEGLAIATPRMKVLKAPPGTVMATFHSTTPAKLSRSAVPFPMEF